MGHMDRRGTSWGGGARVGGVTQGQKRGGGITRGHTWERVLRVADPSFTNCNLGPKTALFCPKPPQYLFKMAKQREMVAALHMQLDFPFRAI